MNNAEISRLKHAVACGQDVWYLPLGRRIERVGVAPSCHGEIPEPSEVAFLVYPPTDYVALYNCALDDFGVIRSIP